MRKGSPQEANVRVGRGLSRLRGAVGGKGAERGQMGIQSWGEVREDQENREAGAAELLRAWEVANVGTRAGVQSAGLGAMPTLLPAGWTAGHAFVCPCVPSPSLLTPLRIPSHGSARSVWTRSSKAWPPRRVNLPSSVNNHSRGSLPRPTESEAPGVIPGGHGDKSPQTVSEGGQEVGELSTQTDSATLEGMKLERAGEQALGGH